MKNLFVTRSILATFAVFQLEQELGNALFVIYALLNTIIIVISENLDSKAINYWECEYHGWQFVLFLYWHFIRVATELNSEKRVD